MSLFVVISCLLLSVGLSVPVNVQDISDGPCHPLPKVSLSDFDFELALQFAAEPGFVPLGSKMNYYSTATMLRNLEADSGHDLEDLRRSLCLKLTTGLFETVLTGFHNAKVELSCELNGVGSATCVNKSNLEQGNTTVQIVWSNKAQLLSINCLPNGHAAWNVLSATATVDEKATERILELVEKYGFNKHNAMNLLYDEC